MKRSVVTKYRRIPMLLLTVAIVLGACSAHETPALIETSVQTEPSTPKTTNERKVGTDIKVVLPEGNLERGEKSALVNACTGCHVDRPLGPRFESAGDLPNIMERGEIRMADPAYNGTATTNEEYILESILIPEAYIVQEKRDPASEMTKDYGKLLTKQDLADLLVWLGTFE